MVSDSGPTPLPDHARKDSTRLSETKFLLPFEKEVSRIVDPELKTPAVIEIALMNAIAIVPIAGLLMLVNAPVWWNWSLMTTLLCFAAVMITAAILMKLCKLLDHPKF